MVVVKAAHAVQPPRYTIEAASQRAASNEGVGTGTRLGILRARRCRPACARRGVHRLSAGATAFLKKPFYPADIDEVLARHYGLHIPAD